MKTQMAQMRSYMYQMVEQLNWALSAMDGGAQAQEQQLPGQTTVPASDNKKEDDTNQRMANLRDLIIKSADVVRQEMDRLATELKGSYVAQSEFGDYLERISQRIEADPSQLSQYFKFASDIRADVDRVGVDFASYKTDVEGYIRQGIVGYDGTVPIIGIAIGQDIRTSQTGVETEQGVYDVIDKSSNMSVWTTEKLSFYIGGQETAYFSNGKLTVAQIAADRITGAGEWDVSFTSGVKFKWIGG
nr:MAG TPA: hypothetical protein [Caudoviricetes sp.]